MCGLWMEMNLFKIERKIQHGIYSRQLQSKFQLGRAMVNKQSKQKNLSCKARHMHSIHQSKTENTIKVDSYSSLKVLEGKFE